MPCASCSLISACCILICATVVQALQGYPDAFSVSFLLLGVTSVIHHCRLDEWWKRDVWRALDYIMIAVFFLVAGATFRRCLLWWTMCLAVLVSTAATWSGVVAPTSVPVLHACMHITVCLSVMYLWKTVGA